MSGGVRIFGLLLAVLLACFSVSCKESVRSVADVPDDPSDEVAAVFRFEDGKPVIRLGKVHSHQFKWLCAGDYPNISTSGKFVAYGPAMDFSSIASRHLPSVKVIEPSTGRITSFNSIPADVAPYPGSFWSLDETLLAFAVHDFVGSRGVCVVSMVDGSYWRGTEAEFGFKFGRVFGAMELQALRSTEGRLIETFKHVGALYFHPDNGRSIRLTPENMAVATTPIWTERTGEALFVGSYVKKHIFDEDGVEPGRIYLIKPEAKDWAHASRRDWGKVIVTSGEQVSSSGQSSQSRSSQTERRP